MKIGVYFTLTTPLWGGAYTFENEIINSLVKLHNESKHTFVLVSKKGYMHTKKLPKDIGAISLKFSFIDKLIIKLNNLARYFFAIFNVNFRVSYEDSLFERLILNSDIDMLWSTSQSSPTMALPYIVTVLDLDHRVHPFFPEVSSDGIWEDRENNFNTILKRASIIVTGTETGKTEIERFYNVPSRLIITMPLPTPAFSLESVHVNCESLKKYGIPDNYMFYPAQFWPHKNHIGVLLTLRVLKEKHNIILPVVFTGADKGNLQYIKKMANQLDIKDQIYFLNFVPQEDLIALYKNAFALIFLSYFGPDNLPPIEAFALGCPVIAAKVSGAEEQLGDAAILVDPCNENEIAQAVKMLYENLVLRENLVQRGYERAKRFTSDDYVRGIISAIDEFMPMRRCWDNSDARNIIKVK